MESAVTALGVTLCPACALTEVSGRAVALFGDVTPEQDVGRLFAGARDAFGPVDVRHYNVGIGKVGAAMETSAAVRRGALRSGQAGARASGACGPHGHRPGRDLCVCFPRIGRRRLHHRHRVDHRRRHHRKIGVAARPEEGTVFMTGRPGDIGRAAVERRRVDGQQ